MPISTDRMACFQSNTRRDYVPNCVADSVGSGSVQAGDSEAITETSREGNASGETEATGMSDLQQGKAVQTYSSALWLLRPVHRWYATSVVCVLATELCSLGHRIRWALEIRSWGLRGYRVPLPTVLGSVPSPQCETCRRAYISDMQRLSNRYPSLTIVDSQLLAQFWRAGWQSALRTDTPQNQRKLCSLCSPMGSDSVVSLNDVLLVN